MSTIQQTPTSTAAVHQRKTGELIHALRRFPSSVLPVGILRELQSRGESIHDELVTTVRNSLERMDDGLGSGSNSSFFALALLAPFAKRQDRALIESILTSPGVGVVSLFGDLMGMPLSHLIANIFRDQIASEVIDWINALLDHPKLDVVDSFSLYSAISLAVAKGYLEREVAIATLTKWLNGRANERDDAQSAVIVCELRDLSARDVEVVDILVRDCFRRKQIDTSMVDRRSWDQTDDHGFQQNPELAWVDPAAELSHWCYDFETDSFDPVDAVFRVNENASRLAHLDEASTSRFIDQLRQSTDQSYPRQAIRSLNQAFPDAYHPIIELIRNEVGRYDRDRESWSGNGAYLGLALLVAHQMPMPTDLLQSILGMSESDREKVFGDQFGLIVKLLSLTPMRQFNFVDQWIWDSSRSNADRREMVDFYASACDTNLLERDDAIATLASGLERALREEPILIGQYATNLALLSPKQHVELIEQAFDREDADWFPPLDDLRRMLRDSSFAEGQYREWNQLYNSAEKIISAGVMFDTEVLQEKPRFVPRVAPIQLPQEEFIETGTVRNEERTPRNAPCPCGSGKKYKNCCLRTQ